MSFAKHKIGKTYFECKGTSKKKIPLICLHGGPGGSSDYLKPLLALSKDRPVFIYDQIGGAKSTPLKKSQFKIKTFVNELNILLDRWKIDEFHLFGASWGTTLALEYFLQKKRKEVKSIIFQSPLFSSSDWEGDANLLIKKLSKKSQRVIQACHEIGATDSKVYQQAMMEYYTKHVLRDEKKLAKLMSIPNPHGNEVYLGMWGPSEFKPTGVLKSYDKVQSLKKINIPTLFLAGEYDEARPDTVKRYSTFVKDSSFKRIKECSHAILYEKPNLAINEIKAFLEKNE